MLRSILLVPHAATQVVPTLLAPTSLRLPPSLCLGIHCWLLGLVDARVAVVALRFLVVRRCAQPAKIRSVFCCYDTLEV